MHTPVTHLSYDGAMTLTNDDLLSRLHALSPERLAGMRRGVEKESLRANPDGTLALTPHPAALGSALTHPCITTDFSESQLELITAAHTSPAACARELYEIHQFVARALGEERMWAASMPCDLPTDETIPLGRYGTSNVGRAKSVYRMGLGHRYGRRMQTISGIHYNWSLPGLDNDAYFALIRNFRRHAFLLLVLFGATPAVCASFVQGRSHSLQPLAEGTFHLPHATSLRMGRLGYQSDAQAALNVSYNCLEGYAASLHGALTTPHPPYEAIGVRNLGGEYNQLATSLLQIENEFYGTIRPKCTIRSGERPLHALRERGVEYVEVRLMDLDPFEVTGIAEPTMHFLDVFLLHCLLTESPPDTPQETVEMARNQHRTASAGRERGLTLERGGRAVPLVDWAAEVLAGCAPIAARLDALQGTDAHTQALAQAHARLADPDTTPSARVLATIAAEHGGCFRAFGQARSEAARAALLAEAIDPDVTARLQRAAEESVAAQRQREAADTLPFEEYRLQYLDPQRLMA
ncbi:MAG: glutamate--cysteine ligase GshA [Pseudomonadota bacterium]